MSGAPYQPVGGLFFDLPGPSGGRGAMTDIVTIDSNPRRYVAEVKLLQQAIATGPDGIIGPNTRLAAIDAYSRRTSKDTAK